REVCDAAAPVLAVHVQPRGPRRSGPAVSRRARAVPVSRASRYAPARRPGGRLAVLPRRPVLRTIAASRGPVVGDRRLPARSSPRSDARPATRPHRLRALGPRRQRRDLRRDPAAGDSAMTVQTRTEPSIFVKVQPEGSTGARVDLSANVLSLVYEDCEG